MKKVIASPDAPKAVGPYSQAIEAGGTLYISGQLPETIEEQTAQSLDNTAAILKEAGYTFEDVVKTTVLLDDMHNFAAMNGVYARYYTKDMPARVCYQVAKLPMGVKVEIDTIAVKK